LYIKYGLSYYWTPQLITADELVEELKEKNKDLIERLEKLEIKFQILEICQYYNL
jgi:hypothetical protein